MERLAAQQPPMHLLIGAPPEVEPEVRPAVERLRAQSRVHFAGYLPDPRPLYAAMDCLVLPSWEFAEGLGMVILEAAALERPAIASRVTGCVDALVHGQTGWLVESHHPDELEAAMRAVACEPDRARHWGRAARRWCVARFRREVVWEAYADLYTELGRRRRARPDGARAAQPAS
jgi:glycosyltransferase involved in cell wall biosynthesis